MTEKQQPTMSDPIDFMRAGRLTRANLLKAAGFGVAAAAFPLGAAAQASFPFFPKVQGSYTTEDGLKIAVVLHTMAHFGTSFLTAAVKSSALNLKSNATLLAVIQAAVMEEDLHAENMDTITAPYLGVVTGTPLSALFYQDPAGHNAALPNGATYIGFTLPDPAILTDQKSFLTAWESLQSLSVAAYIAAVREFAELGQPTLAKWAAQTLGVEAEHRVLARAALALLGDTGSVPPNNKGFETEYLLYVRDAAATLIDWGYWAGSGASIPFANPAAARAAAGPMATTCTPVYPGAYLSPGSACHPASPAGVIQAAPNNATVTDASLVPGERL